MNKYHVLDYQEPGLPEEVKTDIRKVGQVFEWSEGLHYYSVDGLEPSEDFPHIDKYILKTLGINETIIIDYWW